MKGFTHDWAELRSDAERRFLGQSQVVGIAMTHQPSPRLVFFLECGSVQAETDISRWADQRGVDVKIQVTGAFHKLPA